MPFQVDLQRALRHGLGAAILLALAVGALVSIGANLSNATPSKEQPFGWPGPANFEGGVATVRPGLVLATTLPALLLGLRSARASQGSDPLTPAAAMASGGILIGGAILVATGLGAWSASPSPSAAYFAFWVAHTALALSFFAIGYLAQAASARHGAVAALAFWCLGAVLLDDYVKWQLFRSEGYDNLAAGHLPGWFYLVQVLSPVAAYRALLIVWQPGFRDWLEHAALDKATLPAWLNPAMITGLLALLWVALPLGIAWFLLRRRGQGRPASMPALPVTPASAAQAHGVSATPAPAVEVLPYDRPDRPAPMGLERRPRLNAHQRTEVLRASLRPRRLGHKR